MDLIHATKAAIVPLAQGRRWAVDASISSTHEEHPMQRADPVTMAPDEANEELDKGGSQARQTDLPSWVVCNRNFITVLLGGTEKVRAD